MVGPHTKACSAIRIPRYPGLSSFFGYESKLHWLSSITFVADEAPPAEETSMDHIVSSSWRPAWAAVGAAALLAACGGGGGGSGGFAFLPVVPAAPDAPAPAPAAPPPAVSPEARPGTLQSCSELASKAAFNGTA